MLSQEGIISQEILYDFGMYQGNTNQQDAFCLVRKTYLIFLLLKQNLQKPLKSWEKKGGTKRVKG